MDMHTYARAHTCAQISNTCVHTHTHRPAHAHAMPAQVCTFEHRRNSAFCCTHLVLFIACMVIAFMNTRSRCRYAVGSSPTSPVTPPLTPGGAGIVPSLSGQLSYSRPTPLSDRNRPGEKALLHGHKIQSFCVCLKLDASRVESLSLRIVATGVAALITFFLAQTSRTAATWTRTETCHFAQMAPLQEEPEVRSSHVLRRSRTTTTTWKRLTRTSPCTMRI